MKLRLLPKGMLAYLLGTYLKENQDEAKKELQAIHDGIVKYLGKNGSIVVKNGQLDFRVRKWWMLW